MTRNRAYNLSLSKCRLFKTFLAFLFLLCSSRAFAFQANAQNAIAHFSTNTSSEKVTNDIAGDSLYGVPAAFVEDLKKKTFTYFWEVVDSTTWQTDDRYPTRTFTSIAATGFALPVYIIGIHNDYITREECQYENGKTFHGSGLSTNGKRYSSR